MTSNETPAEIRREKHLLLNDLARRAGLATSNASALEAGRLGASEDNIRRWAKAAGVPYWRAYGAIWRAVLAYAEELAREARIRLAHPPRRRGA